jgi:hypothetical protein
MATRGSALPIEAGLRRDFLPFFSHGFLDEDTVALVRRLAVHYPDTVIAGIHIIAGEQITPGAPWRIRLTDDLKARSSPGSVARWRGRSRHGRSNRRRR